MLPLHLQASGDEVLYMRPDALKVLQSDNPKSKPISGGIPHCFPQVLADGQRSCLVACLPGLGADSYHCSGVSYSGAAVEQPLLSLPVLTWPQQPGRCSAVWPQ